MATHGDNGTRWLVQASCRVRHTHGHACSMRMVSHNGCDVLTTTREKRLHATNPSFSGMVTSAPRLSRYLTAASLPCNTACTATCEHRKSHGRVGECVSNCNHRRQTTPSVQLHTQTVRRHATLKHTSAWHNIQHAQGRCAIRARRHGVPWASLVRSQPHVCR